MFTPNINVDLSEMPSWLLALLLTGAIVMESITGDAVLPGLSVEDCLSLCQGQVIRWNTQECECGLD